jgi:hypothetical protein
MIADSMVSLVKNSSVIRAMFEEGNRLAKLYGAENVYDFSLGNPNVPAPAEVNEAVKDIVDNEESTFIHGYMSNAGYEDVRQTIAESLNRRFGTHFNHTNIVMTVGAAGGLNTIFKTLLNPGEEVMTFAPFFGEYRNYVSNFGGKLVVVSPNTVDFQPKLDELQIQINNDSLREKLESEKLKTQRLLEELRQVKSSNAAEIMRLKKELKTVRAVLRTYVIQIDSLNRLNAELTKENQEVKNKYSAATAQISTLSKEKKSLNEKVSLAAQLDATNIIVNPMNKRGKTARKVKDVKKISIQFTIVKNITAETGNKTLYIRIAKPDNDILTKSEANTFAYEDRNIGYSIKKYIEYTGEEQTVTVYWNVEEFLPSGNYRVYIFADGNMIGQGSFSMK